MRPPRSHHRGETTPGDPSGENIPDRNLGIGEASKISDRISESWIFKRSFKLSEYGQVFVYVHTVNLSISI